MSFVIDSSEWCFDGLTKVELEAVVDSLIERISRVTTRGESLWFGDDFQSRPMLAARSLWQLFDDKETLSLSRETQQELAALLNRLNCYLDESQWPLHYEVLSAISISGAAPIENLDVLWSHLSSLDGRPTGCIGHTRAGKIQTNSTHGSISLHWLGDATCHSQFWRDAIVLEGDSAQTLRRLAPHAFPDLYFPDTVWRGCNDFIGGYYSQSIELRRHLAALNDFGKWVFTASPDEELVANGLTVLTATATSDVVRASPPDQLVISRFNRLGLDVAPEKSNVRKDKTAREAREIRIGGRLLYCEWHSKLQRHQNRVHIHPPTPESGGRLIVAIFTSHLPLPG